MDYVQRASGIFIRQNLIPQADLQSESVFPGGQVIYPGINQVLAYNVGYNPAGPRLLQSNLEGSLDVSLGTAHILVLAAPRTDTANFQIGPFPTPAFTMARMLIRATAVSGTSPSMTVYMSGVDSYGNINIVLASAVTAAITSAGQQVISLGGSLTTAAMMMSPYFYIQGVITGTTPSFTWYGELHYK